MRRGEREIEEKVKKKNAFLNGNKTLQNKESKAIESVEWIEPCLNWQSKVSLDQKMKKMKRTGSKA